MKLTAHAFRGIGYLVNNIQKCFIYMIKGHQILKKTNDTILFDKLEISNSEISCQ